MFFSECVLNTEPRYGFGNGFSLAESRFYKDLVGKLFCLLIGNFQFERCDVSYFEEMIHSHHSKLIFSNFLGLGLGKRLTFRFFG